MTIDRAMTSEEERQLLEYPTVTKSWDGEILYFSVPDSTEADWKLGERLARETLQIAATRGHGVIDLQEIVWDAMWTSHGYGPCHQPSSSRS